MSVSSNFQPIALCTLELELMICDVDLIPCLKHAGLGDIG
jgi:hypothetical protein